MIVTIQFDTTDERDRELLDAVGHAIPGLIADRVPKVAGPVPDEAPPVVDRPAEVETETGEITQLGQLALSTDELSKLFRQAANADPQKAKEVMQKHLRAADRSKPNELTDEERWLAGNELKTIITEEIPF